MAGQFIRVGEELVVERIVERAPRYAEIVDIQTSVTSMQRECLNPHVRAGLT